MKNDSKKITKFENLNEDFVVRFSANKILIYFKNEKRKALSIPFKYIALGINSELLKLLQEEK